MEKIQQTRSGVEIGEEGTHLAGKLKIFFGYAAGVGKTYAMLEAAHQAQKEGMDVVVGYVEPHARPDTLALLDGLESLPCKEIDYRGIKLKEFDLDRALQRKPQLILVDELAHNNAQGCRHTKRYQDVEELLQAGINVYTTVNERLSRDDDNAGESNSIVHQKQMLEDYAMKHGFTNLVHFTDDGWSGATFDRPSWNRLVEGVKNGEITACICKDMSRIGRDHLQVGFFTDILFREKEVRFIAINNGIDSDRQETSEFAPFLNIMNEWFVRDTSKKIKAVLKSRGSSGNAHTSNIPPYGYLKDPENPDHWIIDEEAAEVVRRIYRMTIEGKGPYQIARELSEEKIERPSYYLGKKGLGNHASNYDKENPYMWRGNQVTTLIARPEYIGKTVNFRTFKNSYKDKKTKRADKEDWVVFDDTHLADLNEQATERCSLIIEQMKQAEGVTETMKADNQMLWVQSMNSIRNRAEEIIRQEMIYC